MNIGNLYVVKEFYWLLFPSKETVLPAAENEDDATAAVLVVVAATDASYLSNRLKCEVTYFPPGSHVVFLEENGEYKRVLTADGKIGWTWFNESYNDCFEEVKS